MKNNIRKIMVLCLVMFVMSIHTGCGKTPVKDASTSEKPTTKKELILGMTTSIEDSGLLDVIVPAFEKKSGYKVKPVSVGTGQALALARKGEVDALLVNSPKAEQKEAADGAVINRKLVMHNDFVIVGASADKAQIKGKKDVLETLSLIAKNQAPFVSRGDDSGTDKLDKSLWKQANITPAAPWYIQAGAGMTKTLEIGNEKQAYVLTDRASYIFDKKNLSLEVLVEGDPKLLNLYHVMEVNPEKFPKTNTQGAKDFSNFLLSDEGQALIREHGKKEFGKALFNADAGKTEKEYGF